MLGICQQLDCLRNNGQGHMSSFKLRQACTLGRKPNVGGSLMLYCGFLGLVRNGGCSQPNVVIGAASINASPDGVNAEYGSVCTSIWSMTPTWNTSSSTAQWSVPIFALQGRQQKRRGTIASPRSQPRWVHYKGPCRCRLPRQPVEIQIDRRAGAGCHSG